MTAESDLLAAETSSARWAERFRSCHRAVGHSLEEAGTAAEAAPRLLEALTVALGWPAAELFLADDSTEALLAVGHSSKWPVEPDGFFGHTPVKGAGVTGRVWESGRTVWVPDIGDYEKLLTPFEKTRAQVCVRHGIRTVVAVPICDGDTLLGVLTCYAQAAEPQHDLLTLLLDGVAAQIAVWIARRRAEQYARDLTRTQDDFITLVGHELRTPITSITAHAAMLQDEAAGLDADHQEMIAAIARNAAAVQQIVETLLDLAGLEAGHLPLEFEHAELRGIVLGAVAQARQHAASSGVRLHVYGPDEAWLSADPARLRQVVDDLLDNAIRYSPHGGDVRIVITDTGSSVELRISDVGIGTVADERARVFDRFFRGSNVRHQGSEGSGLGLSRARAIVTKHRGRITLADNLPTGTTVLVQLPGLTP